MPGVTMRKSGPFISRISLASYGEETVPSIPASLASLARFLTDSAMLYLPPISFHASSSMLVNTVTAKRRGRSIFNLAASSRTASAAASIMARPPVPCSVMRSAPRRVRARMLWPTVLGISWIFKSRKTCFPWSFKYRTASGPAL